MWLCHSLVHAKISFGAVLGLRSHNLVLVKLLDFLEQTNTKDLAPPTQSRLPGGIMRSVTQVQVAPGLRKTRGRSMNGASCVVNDFTAPASLTTNSSPSTATFGETTMTCRTPGKASLASLHFMAMTKRTSRAWLGRVTSTTPIWYSRADELMERTRRC